MKLLIAFPIIVIALSVVYGAPADPWNEYKTKHSKNYGATEDAQRRQLFLAKDAIIKKHNSQKNVLYQLGHNQFSDMTPTELSQYRGAVKPADKTRSLESMLPVDAGTRQLPTSLDYRGNACLAPVKNQGQCGWVLAAITALEFARCKKYGSLVTLSEQQLVDCDPYDSDCNGGWYTNAWNYLRNLAGRSARQSLYSYTAKNATCKFKSSMIGAKISSYGNLTYLTAKSPTSMQSALERYGPLSVAITVINSFYSYKSGVYTDAACDNKGVNHGVVVVGWGNLSGTDYWIVRNSWGSGWGSAGYILMQRGVNKCSIETYPVAVASVV